MKTKILVVAVVWLSGFLFWTQAQSQLCGCADKEALLNYLNLTQMAIQENKFQLDLITKQEIAEGKPVMFSDDGYKKLQETFDNALRAVHKKGVERANIKMNTGDCSIKTSETGNFCVQQAETIRARLHQKVCLDSLPRRNAKTESYLDRMEMKWIVREAIAAWEAAREFTLQMLRSLPKDCRPNDWFGYVVYQRVTTTTINTAIPANNRGMSRPSAGITITTGGSETQISKNTYTGTILVEGGKASSARAYAAESFDQNKTIAGRVYCSPTKPDVGQVDTSGEKRYAEGESQGNAGFRLGVYPAKGKYSIFVDFFTVPANGQRSSFFSGSGGCGGTPKNNSFSWTTRLNGPDNYGVKDETITSPDHLEGSKLEKPPSGNSNSQMGNSSMNRTDEIQVRWSLRKLSPK